MIPQNRHTKEWIIAQQAHLGMVDPIILEKAIFALTLLDLLARTNLNFVFKGGTALLLHLPQPNRLSIDIDIVCNTPKPDFESALNAILANSPFLRWDEQMRGERGLPGRRHYRFHFLSPTQGQETHILLDVVTEPNVLLYIIERPVNTAFLVIAEPITVKTPRLESLKIAAAKAARLAMILKGADYSKPLPRFAPALAIELGDKHLDGPFACLNRLKSFAPEVFFYWT